MALVLFALLWLVPWLGRRGELNAIIEGILSSCLTVPVHIESIDTQPLSHLKVTRLSSVSAHAEERFHFTAKTITVEYEPVELLSGRIDRLIFEGPSIFIDLDKGIGGVAKVPEAPRGVADSAFLLPVTMDRAVVEDARVTVRVEGKEIALSDVHIEVWQLGRAIGQRFLLRARVLGALLRASGGLDVLIEPGRPTRYAFRKVKLSISGLSLPNLERWLFPGSGDIGEGKAGLLEMEGTIAGTWPDEVHLELSSGADEVSASYANGVRVRGASASFRLEAAVRGEMDHVAFTFVSQGQGAMATGERERSGGASAEVRGTFERQGGGRVRLDPSHLRVAGLGEVRFSGELGSLLRPEPPSINLRLELPALELKSALEHVPEALLPEIVPRILRLAAPAEERLALNLEVAGTIRDPRANGSLEIVEQDPDAAPRLHATFAGVAVDLEGKACSVGNLALEAGPLEARMLAEFLAPPERNLAAGGSIKTRLDVRDLGWSRDRATGSVRGTIDWREGRFELPRAGATGVGATVSFEARLEHRALGLSFETMATLDEVLIGRFYGKLDQRPVSLRSALRLRWGEGGGIEDIDVERLDGNTPFTGPVSARGRFFGEGGISQIDVTLQGREIDGPEAFEFFVRGPLGPSFTAFEKGSLEGKASMILSIKGLLEGPTFAGRLTMEGAALRLGALEASEADLDVPFEIGKTEISGSSAPLEGVVRARRIALGPIPLEDVRLPLRFKGGTYELRVPTAEELFGGVLELDQASLSPSTPDGLVARVSLRGEGLDLKKLTEALDLPRIRGKLLVDLNPLVIRGSRLEAPGAAATIRAFGGRADFRDLTVENVAMPYSDLRLGEGLLRGIRLSEIGDVFHFGVMSGVLDGTVRNLRITGGEISTFEVDVETVPAAGVSQYLNRQAIESIRRILSGPLGAVEETFFSKFYYRGFGFRADLKSDILWLKGKHVEDGREYLMYADWYQFPQVSIINRRPDRPYDWQSIVSSLRGIYEGKPENHESQAR